MYDSVLMSGVRGQSRPPGWWAQRGNSNSSDYWAHLDHEAASTIPAVHIVSTSWSVCCPVGFDWRGKSPLPYLNITKAFSEYWLPSIAMRFNLTGVICKTATLKAWDIKELNESSRQAVPQGAASADDIRSVTGASQGNGMWLSANVEGLLVVHHEVGLKLDHMFFQLRWSESL